MHEFTGTQIAVAMCSIQKPESSSRQDALNALKKFDESVELAKAAEKSYDEQERVRALPVEMARRGQVKEEHLRAFNGTTNSPSSGLGLSYAVPSNSDPLHEMFKGQDIELAAMAGNRQLRLED